MPRYHPSLRWYHILSSGQVTSTVSIIESCFKKNLGLLQCPSGKCSSFKLAQRPKSHMVKYGHTSDPTLGTSFFLFLLIIVIFFCITVTKMPSKKILLTGKYLFWLMVSEGLSSKKTMVKYMTTEVWVGHPTVRDQEAESVRAGSSSR